jgi:hypothetical protein
MFARINLREALPADAVILRPCFLLMREDLLCTVRESIAIFKAAGICRLEIAELNKSEMIRASLVQTHETLSACRPLALSSSFIG